MRNIRRPMALLLVMCMVLAWFLPNGAVVTKADTYDPYVFILGPESSTVPKYYRDYAKPFIGWSPFEVGNYGICRLFNLTNVDEIQPQEPAGFDNLSLDEKLHASSQAFCADRGIAYHFTYRYRRLDLEQAHFAKSGTAAALNKAKKIRAILRHAFPYLAEPETVEKAANAYFGSEMVTDLTNEELASATQAAVWQFANDLFGTDSPYFCRADFEDSGNAAAYGYEISQCISTDDPLDIYAEERFVYEDGWWQSLSGRNIDRVYEYLINLPGEEASDILIKEDALSLEKVFLEGSGNSCSLTMYVQIDGTVDGDDELVLTAKCGDQTQTLAVGENGTLGTSEGLFPITLTDVSEADCANVELELTGNQTVDDAVFYEAEPRDGKDAKASSQGFAGFGKSTGPVYAASAVNALADTRELEITKVDDQSGNPLSGVAFDLYMKCDGDDLKLGSYVTDADGKITVTVTDDATEYYFVETEALAGYEALSGSVTGGNVFNTWTAGRLEVSKKLINTTPAQVDETFDFELTLDLSTAPVTGNSIPWLTDDYLMNQLVCSKELSWSITGEGELTASFTLVADETVTVDSIPLGATYTLKEIMTEEDREWFSVTTKVDNGAAKKGETAQGTIAEKNAVIFTNTVTTGEVKLGDLEVSKKLVNTTPAQVGETFDFKITLDLSTADANDGSIPWMTDEYLMEQVTSEENLTWTEKNGKYTAEFTVDAGETVTISGIPQGTTYTVEEVFEGEKSEWFTVTTKVDDEAEEISELADGTIAEKNAVIFTNTVVTQEVELGDLNVSKHLINTTPAQVGETFNFKITLDLSTADAYTDPVFWMNDTYLMGKITSTEDLTWTEKDGKYTATFTVDAEETVIIKGIAYGVSYTVEEVLTAEDRQWFSVTTQVGNEAPKNSDTAKGSIAQINAVLFTNTVVTGDELRVGDLEVSKKLVNTTPAVVGETFNFKITLDLSTADAYTDPAPWLSDEYLLNQISCDEALTWTEKDGKYTATFTVDADETVTIHGIAYGVSYTVEEVLTAEDREKFTVTSQVGSEAAKDSTVAQGTVAQSNAAIFTNSVVTQEVKLGDLEVSKKLVNTTPAEVGETFDFKITLDLSTADANDGSIPWMTDEYLMEQVTSEENLTWTEKNGKYTAEFTVDAGETVTISGIPQGTTYTVEEVFEGEKSEWFTVTTKVDDEAEEISELADGTIAEKNAAIFTNSVVTQEVKLGDLEVSKKLINTTPAVVGETFNFKITLDLSTADVYTDPVFWMNDTYLMGKITSTEDLTWTEKDGKYTATFTVDADETVTICGIAYGTTYTIEEVLTAEDMEWFTVQTQVNDEPAKDSKIAQNEVATRNAVLFTNTVVTGPALKPAALSVSKELINTTPAQVGETFDFKITLDLSSADVYTDAAPWMNDEYLMGNITSDEDLTWTEKNNTYTAEFTVDAGETVTIDGIACGASYTVEEIMTEEDRKWFSVTSRVGEEAPVEGCSASGTLARSNSLIFTNTVNAGPELKLGELLVSKKLINTTPAVVGETFNFKLTLDLSTADVYKNAAPWMSDAYLMEKISCDEELTWTEEDGKYTATFTVDADETVTIGGIAYGTSYTVEEVLTEEDREWFESNAQIGDTPVEGSSASGTVAQRNAVIFTNSVVTGPVLETGSVEISKKLINTTPAVVGETFNFRITLDLSTADVYVDAAPWMNDAYLMSFITGTQELTWTEKDGKYTATFTVNADETFAISGIAYGTAYTVEEIQTEEDREWFTVTTQIGEEEAVDGTAVEGTVAEKNALIFTNSVVTGPELKLGKLEVSKKLINASAAKADEYFNFSIVIDFSTADVCQDPAPWMNNDYLIRQVKGSKELTWTKSGINTYTATFTLKADEAITIEGLAEGSGYTLQEELTKADRNVYRVTTQITTDGTAAAENKSYVASGSIAAENAVRFTNEYVQKDTPGTGDFGIGLPALICLLALMSAAVLLLNRRRFL